jgi:hypothetical protein
MIGPLVIDSIAGFVGTMVSGFFKSRDRERDEWLSTPGVATYAPPIVRHHRPWPGAGQGGEQPLGGRRPYRAWPGGPQ